MHRSTAILFRVWKSHLCVSAMMSRKTARSTSLLLKVEAAVREMTISRKAFRASGDEAEELEGPESLAARERWTGG